MASRLQWLDVSCRCLDVRMVVMMVRMTLLPQGRRVLADLLSALDLA